MKVQIKLTSWESIRWNRNTQRDKTWNFRIKIKLKLFLSISVEATISSRNKQLQIISEGIFAHKCKLIATSSECFKCLKYLLFRIIHPLHSLLGIIYLRVKNRSAFCIKSSYLLRICKDALFRPAVLFQNDNHRLHRLHHVWNFLLLVYFLFG